MTLREYFDELDSYHIHYTMYLHCGQTGVIYASVSPRDWINHWLDYTVVNDEISGHLYYFNIDVELKE